MNFSDLVSYSVKQKASDLHLCAGDLPRLRVDGLLHCFSTQPLSGEVLTQWLLTHLSAVQQRIWQHKHQVDFTLSLAAGIRLRVNAFRQQQGPSLAIRVVPGTVPDLRSLGIPSALDPLEFASEGLILVCGATGSGKSTTLAAIIQWLNQHYSWHIITLEDPVEFIHRSQQSLIQQREIGVDTRNFQYGLQAALREDPDVVVLGELRDPQTIRLALTAAETGHLVLATLHSRNTIQGIARLMASFSTTEKNRICSQLADSLRAVLAQQLLPQRGGGRVAAFELLLITPAVSHLIREEKLHQLPSILETAQQQGMVSFAQSKQQLWQQGKLESDNGTFLTAMV